MANVCTKQDFTLDFLVKGEASLKTIATRVSTCILCMIVSTHTCIFYMYAHVELISEKHEKTWLSYMQPSWDLLSSTVRENAPAIT